MNLNIYPRCIQYCNDVLKMSSQSKKALFRRARAFRLQDKLDEAEADLMTVKKLLSKKADLIQVEKEFKVLCDRRRDYNASLRQFANRAMGGVN